mmetsp:Transcript_19425/g.33332  ORF Transcript_19425/g.33332 Transcript_19425/m.33332 type:complete len:142 (-) Transcript_19425:268-693(-)|eukprot:CAMPEP_0183722120 /NCGR_PEP_ID=MMETSP0737-20130205/14175_1 /TAXON_ID=385413 /ORGANISM="Thalassiosira miniscula, Strain CCMP1093" /LENGTH=141 /DNA_ID=CAMNT_0025952227 /DNA_START=65 /DNA_END=490 /DNA_ORIENTATION=-
MADNLGSQVASAVDEKIQEFRTLQETVNTLRSDLGTLMAQRNENELVKQELDVCDQEASEGGEAIVYKQVGPVLIKNDLSEAKETVEKRLEFISGEIKKTESLISKKEEQSQQLALKIQEMQSAMQKAAVEAAKAAAQQAA